MWTTWKMPTRRLIRAFHKRFIDASNLVAGTAGMLGGRYCAGHEGGRAVPWLPGTVVLRAKRSPLPVLNQPLVGCGSRAARAAPRAASRAASRTAGSSEPRVPLRGADGMSARASGHVRPVIQVTLANTAGARRRPRTSIAATPAHDRPSCRGRGQQPKPDHRRRGRHDKHANQGQRLHAVPLWAELRSSPFCADSGPS